VAASRARQKAIANGDQETPKWSIDPEYSCFWDEWRERHMADCNSAKFPLRASVGYKA
jgi:hypothetical protein